MEVLCFIKNDRKNYYFLTNRNKRIIRAIRSAETQKPMKKRKAAGGSELSLLAPAGSRPPSTPFTLLEMPSETMPFAISPS